MTISVKFVVGFSMAFVVAVVAAVTLVITYTVSISAIHTSGKRLAGAMMDTVSAKVTNYNGIAEKAMHDVVNMTTIPGYMVPIDDPEPQWWVKWEVALRTHLMAADFQYSTVGVLYNDGGATAYGPYWANSSYYYGYTTDARTLTPDGTGLCTVVSQVFRVVATNRNCDPVYDNGTCLTADQYTWLGDNRVGGYYSVLALTNRTPTCFWQTPGVDTYRIFSGEFTMYGSCVLVNHTGALLGIINFGRHLDSIGTFLHGTATTPGTQIFLLDPALLLVASTHPTPYQNFYDPGTPGIKAGVNGCVSSEDQSSPGTPIRIGCRSPASLFPYPPLQELASSDDGRAFLLTPTREERYGDVGGVTYFYIGAHIPSRNLIYTFNLVLFLPESDILGDIVTGMNVAIGVSVAVFVIAVVLTNVLLHVLLAPLGNVAERMYRVANLENTDSADGRTEHLSDDDDDDRLFADDQVDQAPGSRLDPSNMTEIRALQVAYETMDTALKSFTRYVPKDVVKELVQTNQICEIAMRPLNCTMLFADIAGFTSICERIAPHVLSGLVKLYFERSSRIVMGHGGIIDKFIGDCIMAVWGAPIISDRHELRGALCAKSLVFETEVDPLRGAFEEVNESLAIRVGVATGVVLAGNMGSSARMNYTVIGDDVNLASRLESLNRYWGTNTMISAATALECQEWLLLRHVVTIAVVGKQQPVEVYEVVGARPDANIATLGTMTAQSEMQTLAEVKRDREREEFDKVFVKSTAELDRMSVGPLVQRLKRKVPIDPAHFCFVAACNEAMAHFGKGNFSACLAALRAVTNDASIPDSLKQCQSLARIARACEDYMSHPPGGEFDGTWKAEGK